MQKLKYLDEVKRTSLAKADNSFVDAGKYHKSIKIIEKFNFWDGQGKILSLWENQKAAVALGLAYTNADRALKTEGNINEAALVKMPTGTGKSGAIAILTRCIPEIKKILVLTPRAALADQLREDIQFRFWGHLGFAVQEKKVWSANENVAGEVVPHAEITHLLPSNAADLVRVLQDNKKPRVVLVGTLQALDQIRRTLEDEDRGLDTPVTAETIKSYKTLHQHLAKFDLVIVDEGHYEPAPSWSRSVRQFDLPTILFSATPFRNDYKLFRVRGRFVMNMSIHESWHDNIIRTIDLGTPSKASGPAKKVPKPSKDLAEDTSKKYKVTAEDTSAVSAFISLVKNELPSILQKTKPYAQTQKIIVRGGSYEILRLLQSQLNAAFSEEAVLIHERVKKDDLKLRQFRTVKAAQNNCGKSRFWLHETKLLEGIDDPEFVAVCIFDPFTNSRQFVQQIGRVLRSTDKKRKSSQTAYMIAPDGVRSDCIKMWDRYLQFENYCSNSVASIVQSEAMMPETVLAQMPDIQYVAGDFRKKLPATGNIASSEVRLPLRAAVFSPRKDFDLAFAKEEMLEAILAEDRFLPRPISDLPKNMFGWLYHEWNSSPYLGEMYISEWRLGVCIVAEVGSFLFVQDTGGIPFDLKRIALGRAKRADLLKLFPSSDKTTTSILSRMSFSSLDMSDRAIRAQAIRTRSFENTFTDLLDPSLIPMTAAGFVNNQGRYLGIARSRISDSTEDYATIPEYEQWVQKIARELNSGAKSSDVFDRYAKVVDVDEDKAVPVSILMELTSETFREYGVKSNTEGETTFDMPYDDLCADIDKNGNFEIVMKDGKKIPCTITYNAETKRYKIESVELDEEHPPELKNRGERTKSLTEHINRDQSFRILTSEDGVVYTKGEFYKTRDFVTDNGVVIPLEGAKPIPGLKDAISEKGEKFFHQPAKWKKESIFGAIKDICDGGGSAEWKILKDALQPYGLVLLDDGGNEIGDFLAIDSNGRRVALIHAKASKDLHSDGVSHIETVGRQAIAGLAFCSTQAKVEGIKSDRWKRKYTANRVPMPTIGRVFKNGDNLSDVDIVVAAKAALTNPSWSKEVWILAGRLIDIEGVKKKATTKKLANRDRQLLMYIESLRTACGRANADLKIFGH